MQPKVKPTRQGVMRLFVLFLIVSFLGWILETISMYVAFQEFQDRGFLTMPLCPIYGFSVIISFLLLGTPRYGRLFRIFDKYMKSYALKKALSFLFYFLIVALIASVAELIVGYISNDIMHVCLWDYSSYRLNIGGYICLEFSLLWGVLMTAFMDLIWPLLVRLVNALKDNWVIYVAIIGATLIICDFAFNLVYVWINGHHFELGNN